MSILAHPSAGDGMYGAVDGSSPSWSQANWHDKGRSHLRHDGDLGSTGFKAWENSQGPEIRPMRRNFEPSPAVSYAEPVVYGAHSTYYARRGTGSLCPEGFRRSQRQIPDPGPLRPERFEGKRMLPEPHGPPPHASSRGLAPELRTSQHAEEPAIPRLARPPGASALRESSQELSYERAMGRKVRVEPGTYQGSGRAGDMSVSYAGPRRPEDDASFFKSLKDTPTFLRFCNSLPAKVAISPHVRRAEELKRIREQERQRERALVSTLDFPDSGE